MTLSDRDPYSREGAIARQLDLLGAKEAAYIVEKGLTTVYRAASQTEKGTLNELERLKLDAACLAKHGTTPYLDYQRRLIEQMAAARDHEPKQSEIVALEVDSAVGSISQAIVEAKCPHGPDGERWTSNERKRVMQGIARAHRRLDALAMAVNLESGGNVVSLPVDGKVK